MSLKLPTVADYMDPDHHAFKVDEPILEAVNTLIQDGITGAPVIDNSGKLVGMLTESQCLRLLTKGTSDGLPPTGCVGDFMATDILTVPTKMDVYYLAGQFLRTGKRRGAVVDSNGKLAGVVTQKDLLRVIQERLQT
ncbi:MAG: CBS domain-containing protein [Rhodobacterales bacterium]|nr:CBS domain-containing protein [Rhodobacterales bacterium]